MLYEVITFASSMAELSLPALMSVIVDKGVAAGDIAVIWRTGAQMLAIAFVGVAANLTGGSYNFV